MALSASHRREMVGPASGLPAAGEDSKVLKAYPTLQSYMRETAWETGEKRETATLMLFCEEGRWKGMLNDRDASCVVFVSGDDVAAVLASLEKGLVNGSLDWRASRSDQKRAKGR